MHKTDPKNPRRGHEGAPAFDHGGHKSSISHKRLRHQAQAIEIDLLEAREVGARLSSLKAKRIR